jgi:hypothetical protein
MASVATSRAVSSFVNFLINGTVSSADAANNVSGALDQNQADPLVKFSAAVSATASVTCLWTEYRLRRDASKPMARTDAPHRTTPRS